MIEKLKSLNIINDELKSIYEYDEYTLTELLCKFTDTINDINENKTDKTGDHLGSWQGISKPTLTEEGVTTKVEELNETVENLNETVEEIDKDLITLNSQLDQNKQESLNILKPTLKSRRAIVTFTSDDGRKAELTKLAPLFIDKGVPYTLSIPTHESGSISVNYLSDLKNLQDRYGFEIVSHTASHINLTTISEEEVEEEMIKSKNWLKENGFKGYDILVYPQGGNNEIVRRLARKHFKVGIGTLPNNGINEYPIRTFDVARVGLGSYFNTNETGEIYHDNTFPSDGSSLEYYKARVDYAIENNQWLVFMMHPWHDSHTDQQQEYIGQLIDYIKSKNVPIMTISEALEQIGNVIDIGDYHYNNTKREYFVTSANGITKSSQITNSVSKVDEYTVDTPITNFPKGITVTPISTSAINNATNKPINLGGTLITNRSFVSEDFSYQEYIDLNTRSYKRNFSSTGVTGSWVNPLKYKSIDVTISATVPPKSTYNHVISNSGINHFDIINAFPTTNIESGISYTVFVTQANEVVVRLTNVTDNSITMVSKAWRINCITVLS